MQNIVADNLFQAITGTIRESVLILDKDLRITFANKSFYATFRVTPDVTEGELIYKLGNGQWNIPELRVLLKDILPRYSFFESFEVDHIFSDIGRRTMLLNARRLDQAVGSEAAILLAIEDITKRKNLEDKLAGYSSSLEREVSKRTKILEEEKIKSETMVENLEKFKLAVDNVSDSIMITDSEGVMTYGNRAIEKITGYKPEEALGKKAGVLWKTPMPSAYYQKLWDTLKKQKKTFTGEIQNKRKNGEEYTAAIGIYPVLDKSGEIIYLVGVERDITKEKKLVEKIEEQLRHEHELEQKERGFVVMTSHQLLTPLALIGGYISMVLTGKYGNVDPEARNYLNQSLAGASRMNRLIKVLLTTSKLESGTIKVEKSNFDINPIIAEVLEGFKLEVDNKKLKIEFSAHGKVEVFADSGYTREVISNLVSNSIKYTESGKVTIMSKEGESQATVTIADTGIGINRENLPHIFERFYLSENWIAKESVSNALGLYICKLLLDLMGGTIRAESNKGQGSTFTFTLPLSKTNA